jgi:uncharacterized membrane protein
VDTNQPGRLEEEVSELRLRVARLEAVLQNHSVLLQRVAAQCIQEQRTSEPVTQPTSAAYQKIDDEVAPVPSVAPPPIERPAISYSAPETTKGDGSLESRIGSQWFNRIGILAVLIGMAWFLKFAIDNHWIGPLGRVLIGLVAGAGLIAWSERFRSHGYAAFSYSLKALGSGILYLSLWAAFSYFHLVPAGVAFAAMIAVTGFNGYMAWAQDSELLSLYAIVGGFATPLLISTGENHEVTLFGYLLLLDAAVLVLAMLRPWSRLLFVALWGTVFFFAAWWFTFYSVSQMVPTALFLLVFFLVFAFAPRLVLLGHAESETVAGWDTLALVLLPIVNATLGFLGFYALLQSHPNYEWAGPWLSVAFAAFYLLLLRLPAAGVLEESPSVLSGLHLAAAVVFLTLAIPLKTHGRGLTIGWLAEGAALLWVGRRVGSLLLRVLAVVCLVIGLVALLTINPAASTTPIFNARFGTYCFAIAVFAFAAWHAGQSGMKGQGEEPDALPWAGLATAAALAVSALILLAVSLEIDSYWWHQRWEGDMNLYSDYRMYAQFTYSAWFMVFGAILLGAGFWRRSAFLRWQALVLLAVAIGKVFLVDVSELSQGYRIVSFLGLGALLLAVSFAYQRDWLNLRAAKAESHEA